MDIYFKNNGRSGGDTVKEQVNQYPCFISGVCPPKEAKNTPNWDDDDDDDNNIGPLDWEDGHKARTGTTQFRAMR